VLDVIEPEDLQKCISVLLMGMGSFEEPGGFVINLSEFDKR